MRATRPRPPPRGALEGRPRGLLCPKERDAEPVGLHPARQRLASWQAHVPGAAPEPAAGEAGARRRPGAVRPPLDFGEGEGFVFNQFFEVVVKFH